MSGFFYILCVCMYVCVTVWFFSILNVSYVGDVDWELKCWFVQLYTNKS